MSSLHSIRAAVGSIAGRWPNFEVVLRWGIGGGTESVWDGASMRKNTMNRDCLLRLTYHLSECLITRQLRSCVAGHNRLGLVEVVIYTKSLLFRFPREAQCHIVGLRFVSRHVQVVCSQLSS